jgi:hypothetical protein
MRRALLVLGALAACARAQASPGAMGDFVGSASKSLDLRLGRLEDPEIGRAAAQAVSRGVKVRLLLSWRPKANRLAAPALRQGGLELRWQPTERLSYGVADQSRLFCAPAAAPNGGNPALEGEAVDDAALASALEEEFDKAWGRASERLPENLSLNDALEALPDPRENQPHVTTKRRKM